MSPGPEHDLWTQLVAEYEAQNPNVKINLSISPWSDFWQQLAVLFAGNEHPDLVWMHYSRFKDYAELQALMPLDDFIARDSEFDLNAFAPPLIGMFMHRENLYVIPKDNGGTAVWYNMDMFDDAGVAYPFPGWTWDDFLAMAQKLTVDTDGDGNPDRWGVNEIASIGSFGADDWHHEGVWAMIKSFGGDTYTDDFRETLIDHPKTIEALQFMADLRNRWRVVAREEAIAGLGDPFRIGRVAMSAFPHAAQGYWIRYENRPIQRYGVEFLPSNTGQSVIAFGATGFAIPSGSKAPDAAWEFIKWATSRETILKVQQHWRWGSPRLDTMGQRFRDQVEQGIQIEHNWERIWVDPFFNPDIQLGWAKVPAGAAQINTIIDTTFDPVWYGQVSAEIAARQAKPRIDRILQRIYGR